ncbi:MAG: hypothetical protein ACF8AM_14415 [Rhodopirellula sp. JB055]|uniref:hypothetical protein n=1 Tax=Rhodopirellula sp. JB055 TaxID=3342846 RepID=UPI00370B582F
MSNHNMFVEKWIPAIKSGTYHNFELYNLKNDPGQTKNLAAEQPERVEAMKQRMLQINASIMQDAMDWHLGPDQPNETP